MATDFYTRSGGGRFLIVLETDRPEHYKFMQAAARICVDGKQADFAPVVHGRWLKDRDGDEYCSKCSRYMPVSEVTGDPSAHDYCPNCGAKMDAKDGASDEP